MRSCVLLLVLATVSGCNQTLFFFDGGDAGDSADAAPTTCAVACDAGLSCEPALQQCVMPCAEGPTEHDCPASAPTCDEKARYCVSCTSDEQCVAITDDGNVCNLATGKCVGCLDDNDCSDLAPRCDPSSLTCVECLTSADCLDADECDPLKMTCD
jgi:hypothetical protein